MTRILDCIYFLWYNVSTSSNHYKLPGETEGELFVFLFFNKLSAQEKEQIMGYEKEYLRTQRVECARCRMFAWGHQLLKREEQYYHGNCLELAEAEAKKKVSILHLVGLEESIPIFAEEQRAA